MSSSKDDAPEEAVVVEVARHPPPPTVEQVVDDLRDDDDNSADDVDPFSYPATPQGLDDFLAAIITDVTVGVAEPPKVMIYQATSIVVEAASTREITIPILTFSESNAATAVAGGGDIKVDWEASVEEHDILFGLSLFTNDSTHTVQTEETLAPSAKGTFIIPFSSSNSTDDTTSTTTTTTTTAILLELDNSFSWITPKKVSYTVSIIPPPNANKIARLRRANKALEMVQERLAAAVATTSEKEERGVTAAAVVAEQTLQVQQQELERLQQLVQSTERKLASQKMEREEAHRKATETAKEEAAVQKKVDAEVREMEDLKRRMKELELELSIRVEHVSKMKCDVREKLKRIMEEEAETANARLQVQQTQLELESTAEQLQQKCQQVSEMQAKHDAAVAEEEVRSATLQFMETQKEALQSLLLI